jgi:hypothetical protein
MDIITGYIALIGLIGQFRTEKGAAKQTEFNDFLEYLIQHNHRVIVDQIEQNSVTTVSVKALLKRDIDQFREQLNRIENALAGYSSNFDGFVQIAQQLRPDALLSQQAFNILIQMNESEVSTLIKYETDEGVGLIALEGDDIEIPEPRFIEDDLMTLVEYGLLRQDNNSQGQDLFKITRNGGQVVS